MALIRGSFFAGLLFVAAVQWSSTGSAQEWVRFRGPNGTGESEATTVPGTWTQSDYNWKTELPGIGHSSPVIWGKRVFLLMLIRKRRLAMSWR